MSGALDSHRRWIGLLQPTGLVVAPDVLLTHGVVLAEDASTLSDWQARLAVHLDEPDRTLRPGALPAMLRDLLEWGPDDLQLAPEALSVALPEFGVTLRAQHAVPAPDASPPWQILVLEEPTGTDLDAAPPDDGRGWAASPQARMERLLRETGVPAALLSNGVEIRLITAPRGESAGHIAFPLAPMLETTGRPILAAFRALLEVERLFGAPERRLPTLLADSRRWQASVSEELSAQVLSALHELLRGLLAADARTGQDRILQLAKAQPDHVYAGLLTVLMRLVFVLYAEDRGLFPQHQVWQRGYALGGLFARLREDAAANPDTMDHRYGAWAQLVALFRIVYGGARHDGAFALPARRGGLFDPGRFPFLEGRDAATDAVDSPRVSDGCVHRILERLMVLQGERLSYRSLDVEQIGAVYETLMGFTVQITAGQSLAVRPDASGGAAAIVDLDALLAEQPSERAAALKKFADRKASQALERALRAATDVPALVAALDRVRDRDASPDVLPPGTPVLQPTEARRRSGSHYTPRSLTAPIVESALRPHLGLEPTPERILSLRVLDPAMGSGAFLVEACRQLAEALVSAWTRTGMTPPLPPDEDARTYARRIVAGRCLCGVDRNPMAVEIARLSLWLATLARDHEFTFLDHALRWGDALLGLPLTRIADLSWEDTDQPGLASGILRGPIARAEVERRRIREALEGEGEAVLAPLLARADAMLDQVREVGDAVVAAFFGAANARQRRAARLKLAADYYQPIEGWRPALDAAKASVRALSLPERPFRPFHWEVEFPEVFARENPGFDVIVGNPPFAGKNTITDGNAPGYLEWLQAIHPGAHGNADLAAHFFRRAGWLLRNSGTLGLIATNTIRQGDTRDSGLRPLLADGFSIYRAQRRLTWPGQAAVVVCVIHMAKGDAPEKPSLDGRQVDRISAFLVAGTRDKAPAALKANDGLAYQGSILLGMGFTFDDDTNEPRANRLAERERLIAADPRNGDRIRPYIGGEEVNDSPTHAHRRYAIDFFDMPLERQDLGFTWHDADDRERAACLTRGIVPLDYSDPVASDWRELIRIVRERVKPERDPQRRDALRLRWWQYAEKRPGLYSAIAGLPHVLTVSRIAPQWALTFMPSNVIFAESLVVFPISDQARFAVLQSRVHEVWARFFASSMKDDMRYTPDDCLSTFPFPESSDGDRLQEAARAFYDARSAFMHANEIGLTATHNRLDDPLDESPDIMQLRRLHDAMDAEVLRSYGWRYAIPVPVHEREWEATPGERLAPWRRRWPEADRDRVLDFLWALNKQRAEREAAEAAQANGRAAPRRRRAAASQSTPLGV